MLSQLEEDDDREGPPPTPHRPSPVNMAGRGSSKLTVHDKEAPLALSAPTEQASTSYGSTRSNESASSREVALFMQASELERLGRISQAIKYYEQAFRLNPNVHRLVQDEGLPSAELLTEAPAPASVKPRFQPVVPGMVEEIAASLDPSREPPLGVPDEVLARILRWVGLLHAASLEECARTCKAMYVASRHPTIWRTLYRSARATRCVGQRRRGEADAGSKGPPNTRPRSGTPMPHGIIPNYRQLYFETPRVRTDGLYICRISYFRPGLTDGLFCQPVHLVTYYRYLRFFPAAASGHVALFVVSTEEPRAVIELLRHPPDRELTDVVPQDVQAMDLVGRRNKGSSAKDQSSRTPSAKPAAFRRANLFIGKYCRESPLAPSYSLTLYDPQSSSSSPGSIFALDLTVSRSSRTAVSNVIVCDRYCSLSLPSTPHGSVNVYDFVVKDWGRFLFSRVRSYIS